MWFFFFFSSRRRHTRLVSDWSSDVCSSDLAIAPGYVTTVNWMGGLGKIQDELVPQVPMGRLGTPEDCARVIEFLATDLSDFLTGQVISVDGGMGHLNPYYMG